MVYFYIVTFTGREKLKRRLLEVLQKDVMRGCGGEEGDTEAEEATAL